MSGISRPVIERLAVVSDTHGQVASTQQAVRMLESLDVQCVVHCGDIGSPAIVELFDAWPTHFVFGNVDEDVLELENAIRAAGQTCHGRFGKLEIGPCRIAFLHGDDSRLLNQTTASGQWDLVCYGHTHQAEQHRQARTLVLNPGALHRARPHSLALVTLPDVQASVISL
jgi:hypothetical protein